MPSSSLAVSVIIPAYNASQTLPQTLAALTANAFGESAEIIVVDDGSTDNTSAVARAFDVRLITLKQNVGAARAKNIGARAARGGLLFFTDADILTPPDILARLARAFQTCACDGVVGLLDETIPYVNWASQFKNLWMNFTYARFAGGDRIGLFYTSAAAMRRDCFLQLGGFDENYRGASTAEDTEFGQRAWGAGANIVLEPSLRVQHLKRYTAANVLDEDFKRARALALMRLRKRGTPFFTSVPLFYQLAVPTLYLTLLVVLSALLAENRFLLTLALLGVGLFYLLNSSLLAFLIQKRGLAFGAAAVLFLPLDVFFVGLGMLIALFDFARGQRY